MVKTGMINRNFSHLSHQMDPPKPDSRSISLICVYRRRKTKSFPFSKHRFFVQILKVQEYHALVFIEISIIKLETIVNILKVFCTSYPLVRTSHTKWFCNSTTLKEIGAVEQRFLTSHRPPLPFGGCWSLNGFWHVSRFVAYDDIDIAHSARCFMDAIFCFSAKKMLQ